MLDIKISCSSVLLATLVAGTAVGQQGMAAGEWHAFGGDLGATRYSTLDQITPGNVAKLEVTWRWSAPDNEIGITERLKLPNSNKSTPLLIDGVMYTSTPYGMAVAIDPATGEQLWKFDPEVWKGSRPGNLGFNHKGVAYWSDGAAERPQKRILLGTNTAYLYSIDATTGEPDGAFGVDGRVDLLEHYRREVKRRDLMLNSPVLVVGDLVIQAGSINDRPNNKEMAPGDVHAFDVRTGKLVWTFHNPPTKGETGYDSWEEGSAEYTGNTNVWTFMTADEEAGLLYLPFGTPTNDFYGGHRKGSNLFAESIVCLELSSGKLVWYFQHVHHGIWDWDLPTPPILTDITVDGRKIEGLAQITKQGFVWVLDRKTGEPVWPIEEREVPQSTVPGEETWPTQPFPSKPAPFSQQGATQEMLIDFTPELRAEALEILQQFNYGPIYTPPLLDVDEQGKPGKMTIVNPGWGGSANWMGGAFDPDTRTLYVPSVNGRMSTYSMAKPDASRSNFHYIGKLGRGPEGPDGLPLFKPPYSHVTAIDLNSGEHLWEIPVGDGPRDHPRLAELELPPLGGFGRGYPLLTKELFFLAVGSFRPGAEDNLRAFDKTNGALLWSTKLPANPSGNPMTYEVGGKQYLAVPTGGRSDPSEIVALRLP